MNPDEIQIATSPDQVADLIKAGPKTTVHQSANPTSGASVEEILAQIEKDKMSKEEQAKALDQLREKSKPKVQPLQLKYTWTGNCPNCQGNQIKTLMVENEAGYFAVCYCLTEDVQLESVKVEKLEMPKKFIVVDKDTQIIGETVEAPKKK